MEEKLDFSLPQKNKRGPLKGGLTVLLLLIIALLAGANLFVTLRTSPRPGGQSDGTLAPEQTRELAAKLAQRNLYAQAAELWRSYLNTADLSTSDRAKTLFQIASMYKKAGMYEQAVPYYYRSETAAKLDTLEPEINAGIKECFEKLGRFSALRYELLDRTSYDQSEQAGSKVVAEIGPEKITEADLDAAIESAIENQLAPMSAFVSQQQLAQQKKQMLSQYRSPQARLQFLQSWLAEEVLYRQALSQSLAEKPEVRSTIEDTTRKILSSRLITEQLASKINITETDLKTYYEAHKDQYVEPETAQISHIRVEEQSTARDIIRQLDEGADFAELAQQFSTDTATSENGGVIAAPVQPGADVPEIGDANGLNALIFATEPNSVLPEPLETSNGWEIVKVLEKQPQRQKPFDEVRQEIMMTLSDRKRQDVQQAYIEQMMDKYNVIVHSSKLMPERSEADSAAASD